MSAVLQNEDGVLPAEPTVEIGGKALLLSAGADQAQGMLPFPHSALSVASVVTDFRGWILTGESDPALVPSLPLLHQLKSGKHSQPRSPSLRSIKTNNKNFWIAESRLDQGM